MRAAALLLLFGVMALPAWPQSSAASAEARAAQFVFVIDDSGSMRETDPDRLAVFAIRSLLSMLDGRDEVSIVRLNGAPAGEVPPPVEPLSRNRDAMEALLNLGGKLASYPGDNTTCRSALRSVRGLLNRAYRPNVAQVVFFLTDGECTPAGERPEPADLLQGLRSQADDLFQFYLIRFPGRTVSPQLGSLARATGGEDVEIAGSDATAILHAFATALSRSQGYAAELLAPDAAEVRAHRGARRVRLLAVAPGEGADLGFTVRDGRGRSPRILGQPRAGTHRFPAGKPFRYAALDYRPDQAPVTVGVSGAGEDWKVVALPEYRLSLRMSVLQGDCGVAQPAGSVVETGSDVCFVADLINESGATVDGNLTGQDLEAVLRIRRADQPASAELLLPMEAVGDKAHFQLQRRRVEKGDWVVQPLVRIDLAGPGPDAELRGRSRTVQASSIEIALTPGRFDFGTLRPGDEAVQTFSIRGNFRPSTRVRVEPRERKSLPSCIAFELDGQPEGKTQPAFGQEHTLALRVAPYCGPRSFTLDRQTGLIFVFEGLTRREVPMSFRVSYGIQAPMEIALRVDGGGEREEPVAIPGNRQKDLALKATLAGLPADWPAEDLSLRVSGTPLGHPFILGPGEGERLRVRAEAHPCCAAGSHPAELRLEPASLEGYAPGAEPPGPLVLPLRVEIRAAGVWACYGYWILRGLAVLLLLLLVLYAANIVRNSRFLRPVRVAEKLVPLLWSANGGTHEPRDHRARVLEMIRRSLPWHRRLLTWLQANPLAIGLPGGAYWESLELFLQAQRDLSRSNALLVQRRGFPDVLRRDPESYSGKLFATAQGGVSFLGVPDKEGRIGSLALEGGQAARTAPSDSRKTPLIKLQRSKLLRHPEAWEAPEDGRPAGWLVG